MSKKVIILVLLIIIIGSGIYLLLSKDDTVEIQAMTETPATTAQDTPAQATSTPGTYIDYRSTVIANTAGTKLLFFHAPWCPQCRQLEADIVKQGVPDGVTIIKVDYDSNQSLRQKYGVTLQTTIVKVDDQGNLVSKFVAYEDPSLDAVKRNSL